MTPIGSVVFFGKFGKQDQQHKVTDFPLANFKFPADYEPEPRQLVKARNALFQLNAFLTGTPGSNGLSLIATPKNGFEFNVFVKTPEDLVVFKEKVLLARNFSSGFDPVKKGWHLLNTLTRSARASRHAYVHSLNREQPDSFKGYKVNFIVGEPPEREIPNTVLRVMAPGAALSPEARKHLFA